MFMGFTVGSATTKQRTCTHARIEQNYRVRGAAFRERHWRRGEKQKNSRGRGQGVEGYEERQK